MYILRIKKKKKTENYKGRTKLLRLKENSLLPFRYYVDFYFIFSKCCIVYMRARMAERNIIHFIGRKPYPRPSSRKRAASFRIDYTHIIISCGCISRRRRHPRRRGRFAKSKNNALIDRFTVILLRYRTLTYYVPILLL